MSESEGRPAAGLGLLGFGLSFGLLGVDLDVFGLLGLLGLLGLSFGLLGVDLDVFGLLGLSFGLLGVDFGDLASAGLLFAILLRMSENEGRPTGDFEFFDSETVLAFGEAAGFNFA